MMMTFGLPDSMFFVFVGTVLAGSLAAIHYVVVHVIMRRPFDDRPTPRKVRPGPSTRAGTDVDGGVSGG